MAEGGGEIGSGPELGNQTQRNLNTQTNVNAGQVEQNPSAFLKQKHGEGQTSQGDPHHLLQDIAGGPSSQDGETRAKNDDPAKQGEPREASANPPDEAGPTPYEQAENDGRTSQDATAPPDPDRNGNGKGETGQVTQGVVTNENGLDNKASPEQTGAGIEEQIAERKEDIKALYPQLQNIPDLQSVIATMDHQDPLFNFIQEYQGDMDRFITEKLAEYEEQFADDPTKAKQELSNVLGTIKEEIINRIGKDKADQILSELQATKAGENAQGDAEHPPDGQEAPPSEQENQLRQEVQTLREEQQSLRELLQAITAQVENLNNQLKQRDEIIAHMLEYLQAQNDDERQSLLRKLLELAAAVGIVIAKEGFDTVNPVRT